MFLVLIALASTVLLAVAAIHIYWGRGGLWPGRDPGELLAIVVGDSPSGTMPGPGACFAVAGLLVVGALLPWGALGFFGHSLVGLCRIGTGLAVGVLSLRVVGGMADLRLRPKTAGTPFARLNRRFYTPLCLFLALALGSVWLA